MHITKSPAPVAVPVLLRQLLRTTERPLRGTVLPRFPRVAATRVLGIACTGHGASLAYIDAAGSVRSSQLERWTQKKHMMMFSSDEYRAITEPVSQIDLSINYVLSHSFGRFPDSCIFEETMSDWLQWLLRGLEIRAEDIDLVVTSDGHFATGWTRLGPQLRRWFPNARTIRSIEHHEIHQRQAYWASGFDEAAVLTLDTCGESLPRLRGAKLSGTISMMRQDGRCRTIKEFRFPDMSAGLIYDTTTHHVGFRQGDAGKTMGLAPFGQPGLYASLLHELHLHDDGGFRFLPHEAFSALLEDYVPARVPGEPLTQRHKDVAYAGQAIIDAIVANAWEAALRLTGSDSLVYAGGVALNSVANENAFQHALPARLYIPPNPGDPGQGLGCALAGAYEVARWQPPTAELSDNLGPEYSEKEMTAAATASDAHREHPERLASTVATCIANGYIVARFHGGAEFGPRALGNRSILCDPRRDGMKDHLNLRVKHREPFRPFAPTVLEEHAGTWFEMSGRSSYMLRVVAVRRERVDQVPAIVHVDGTARVQTLAREENSAYWRIVSAYFARTGVPMVLNTSFNVAGKPIVESPEDAVACFAETEIDVLVLGPWVLSKRPLTCYLDNDSGV